MRLKLSELANIAEVIGAIAIVISLIYVGIQVNDSTRAVRSATANETSAAMSDWYIQLGTDQQSSNTFLTGMTAPDSLSPNDLFQFVMQTHGLFLQFQSAYYLSQEGTLDIELQESLTNSILGVRDQPGFLLYWDQRRGLFKPDFRDYVQSLIDTGITNREMREIYQPSNHD